MNGKQSIFLVFFLLTAFLPCAGESVHVILEESYGNAQGLKLPVMETVNHLLLPAGLKPVDAADMTMKITLEGRAVSNTYSDARLGRHTAYAGAHLSGEVLLLDGETVLIKKTFSNDAEPPKTVLKRGFKKPTDAPFDRIYYSFVRTAMDALTAFKGKELLITYMTSADRRVRKAAAWWIGEYKMTSAVDSLIPALKDRYADVTVETLQALAKLKVPRSVDSLLTRELFLDSYRYVQEEVFKALNQMDPGWRDRPLSKSLFPAILSALENRDGVRREAAVHVLAEIYDRRALKPLITALADGHRTRIYAAKVLDKNEPGWRNSDTAKQLIPYFLKLLKDPSSQKSSGAAAALKEINASGVPGDAIPMIQSLTVRNVSVSKVLDLLNTKYPNWGDHEEAVKVIPHFLRGLKSSNFSIRLNCVSVLAAIQHPRVVPPLLNALNDRAKRIEIKAIEGLVLNHDPAARKAVGDMMRGNDFSKKVYAVSYLGKSTAPGAMDLLITALKDDHPTIRFNAVKTLGEKGDKQGVEHLLTALEDSEYQVRKEAFKILADRKDPKMAEPFIRLLNSPESEESRQAFYALRNMTDVLPVEPLLALFKEGSSRERGYARELLMNRRPPVTAGLLLPLLDHPTPAVQRAVIEMLTELKDPRAVSPLIDLLQRKGRDRSAAERVVSALRAITGKYLGYNHKKWRKWWKKHPSQTGLPGLD